MAIYEKMLDSIADFLSPYYLSWGNCVIYTCFIILFCIMESRLSILMMKFESLLYRLRSVFKILLVIVSLQSCYYFSPFRIIISTYMISKLIQVVVKTSHRKRLTVKTFDLSLHNKIAKNLHTENNEKVIDNSNYPMKMIEKKQVAQSFD